MQMQMQMQARRGGSLLRAGASGWGRERKEGEEGEDGEAATRRSNPRAISAHSLRNRRLLYDINFSSHVHANSCPLLELVHANPRARRARPLRPNLVQHPVPHRRHELHEVTEQHDGLRGEDDLVQPERRASRDFPCDPKRIQPPLLLANLGAACGTFRAIAGAIAGVARGLGERRAEDDAGLSAQARGDWPRVRHRDVDAAIGDFASERMAKR